MKQTAFFLKILRTLVVICILSSLKSVATPIFAACPFPAISNSPLSETCTVSTATGIDVAPSETSTSNTGVLTINTGGSLTVNNGGTLIVGSLTIPAGGGSISIQAGGQIKPGAPLYISDSDADGWPDDLITFYDATTSGRRRMGLMRSLSTNDFNGKGADGAVTISTNTNINTANSISGRSCADGGDAVNYSVASLGTNYANIPLVSSGCLAVGDEILLINLQGTSTYYANVGNYETLIVSRLINTTVTTVYFTTNLTKYYGDTADSQTNIGTATTNQRVMLQRVPNYTDVTVNGDVTLTASAWDGTKGGVLFFKANGVTVSGAIDASGLGYRGGTTVATQGYGGRGGESITATNAGGNGGRYNAAATSSTFGGGGGGGSYYNGTTTTTAKSNGSATGGAGGGGGGQYGTTGCQGGCNGGGGGGGGYGTFGYGGSSTNVGVADNVGANGGSGTSGNGSVSDQIRAGGGGGGGTYGVSTLNKLFFGSGGGGGGNNYNNSVAHQSGSGGNGGGILVIFANTMSASAGSIKSNGNAGGAMIGTLGTGGGGGAGGSGLIVSYGTPVSATVSGGAGGDGRAAADGGAGGSGISSATSCHNNTIVTACTSNSQCCSGFCADGVCCNTACTGSTCQRCDSSSNAGAGTCGDLSLTVTHTAGSVAPVTKTVTYGTVSSTLGGTGAKCWITQNLGATTNAATVSEATEPNGGWYWQFNRSQGYKHDGTTLTPAWTITSIDESSNWTSANDPCTLLLGTGWRLPTSAEWTSADSVGGWTSWTQPFASALKLHGAGYLLTNTGGLDGRGVHGDYWSSSQFDSTSGYGLNFYSSYSGVGSNNKAYGFSVRCLKD